MHTGMLWFDNSQAELQVKIQKAVDYYVKKYEVTPDLCLVHPIMLDGEKVVLVNGVTIRGYKPILPSHIWIGVEDKDGK